MYQIIPVTLDFCGFFFTSAKFEKLAIKTAMIPWQKGCYYCNLAKIYLLNRKYKKVYETQKLASNYLKSYNCPCWGTAFLNFHTYKDYNAAIEIALSPKRGIIKSHPYSFISECYLMKGDIENAELYIDKAIQRNKTYSNMAIKAYILKSKGLIPESLEYYQNAITLCNPAKETEKNTVNEIYKDFVSFNNDKIDLLRKQQGLE